MSPYYRQQVQSGSSVFKSLEGGNFHVFAPKGRHIALMGVKFLPSLTSPQALTPTSGLASLFLHSLVAL